MLAPIISSSPATARGVSWSLSRRLIPMTHWCTHLLDLISDELLIYLLELEQMVEVIDHDNLNCGVLRPRIWPARAGAHVSATD